MEPSEQLPDLGSLGADLAWWYREWGPREFKAVLAEAIKRKDCPREYLWEAAAQLAVVRLRKPARLVRQAAAQCAPMMDERFCGHTRITDVGLRIWHRSQQARANRVRQRITELLTRAGLDWDWFGEGNDESIQTKADG